MRGEGCESPSSGNSRPSLPDVSGVSLLTRKQFSSGTRSRVGGLRARPQRAGSPKGKALSEGGGNAVSFVPVPDGKRGDAGRRHAAIRCRGVLVGRSVGERLVRSRSVRGRSVGCLSVLAAERRRPVVFEAGRLSGWGEAAVGSWGSGVCCRNCLRFGLVATRSVALADAAIGHRKTVSGHLREFESMLRSKSLGPTTDPSDFTDGLSSRGAILLPWDTSPR